MVIFQFAHGVRFFFKAPVLLAFSQVPRYTGYTGTVREHAFLRVCAEATYASGRPGPAHPVRRNPIS